jgi:hypothetical protein
VDDANGILDIDSSSEYNDELTSYVALYGMLVVYAAVYNFSPAPLSGAGGSVEEVEEPEAAAAASSEDVLAEATFDESATTGTTLAQ